MNNDLIIKQLLKDLGIKPFQFNRLVVRSPHTYKIYSIPKKSGGFRKIAQPARETKYLQSWLISNVFCGLPVSKNATAYKKGSSIKKNALKHVNNKYFLKMDFVNFFNSISRSDIERHLNRFLGVMLTSQETEIISKICCVKYLDSNEECLSVGAPSSPLLSNSIMFEFDNKMESWCQEHGVIYTRYADDLVFSTNTKGITNLIEREARSIIKNSEWVSLSFNDKKTTHLSKKHSRNVTGLIINNDNKVSLGRDRKRDISKNIFLYTQGHLSSEEIDSLQGIIGFAKHVEPEFIVKMNNKFGNDVLKALFLHRKNC